MKKIITIILVLLPILIYNMPVYAVDYTAETPEDTKVTSSGKVEESIEEGKMKLTFNVPKELAGYDLQVLDQNGEKIDTVRIDGTGSGSIKIGTDTQYYTMTLNTEKPLSLGTLNDSTGYSIYALMLCAVGSAVVIFFITKYITKRNIMKQLHELRGYIHEETLD